jgi:hypothetical protein
MPLSSIAVESGATVSSTGGTADAVNTLGNTLTENQLIFTSDDANVQRSITFSVKRPKADANAPAGFTQGRRNIFMRLPKSLTSGDVTVNSIKFELSCDPETTDAEIDEYLSEFAQVLIDSNVDDFMHDLSVA